ncbi:SDR family NAD(P)-dependent oxidoreductase [Paenibacillus sp. N1-5-1-14]|uniref:SDR family NAD(P)-dependent oxidoreductase n=1 Tax=Paenibacillus radicibacter TaxID=2972488 RepID=UPI002158C747|nr:SDR family NAD(P)-dependent oxidoreductase [Paenibacillus radicibacter]MCR8644643.1 SDR family NAD(P)-dependent oxidoreductase [Paenibacillus radicibacter]
MQSGDIAIIGLDIQLPQCRDQGEVWEFLQEKRVSRRKFPSDRLQQIGMYDDVDQFMEGSYLDQIDEFDHKFFHISQKSADYMEPNQRLTLLSATRALHDAGYLDKIRGTHTSVYASVNTTQQYQYLTLLQERKLKPDLLGMLNSTISSRIHYIYDLKGPSVMTDTACSSSLVSVIQASQALREGTIDSAIVVSSNVYVKPGYKADKLVDILAGDAKTKTFDERSTGTSLGEGVCSVILKRLADAQRDGDPIYGVIKSYAMNNDGLTMNMSSPNPLAQENLIERAWAPLSADMSKLAFIEAHGTGTAIGDTIEFESLHHYFKQQPLKKQSVALTACKSNFGHLDVASGLFSLIKCVLSLQNRIILPHPDFVIPNEDIEFEQSVFYIPDRSQAIGEQALAGISSFGMTGTNAHVVLEGFSSQRIKPSSELPFQLSTYWFPQEANSFAIDHDWQRIETEEALTIQFPLHVNKNWEIREHKFNREHLLVGTSIMEIIAQSLEQSVYNLEQYSVHNLHILSQLKVQNGSFPIVLVLDKESLKATVSFSANGEGSRKWLQFELKKKIQNRPRTSHLLLETADMEEMIVTSQVGETDESDISISARWDVVDQLWVNQERTKALVKLKVPAGYEKEFKRYRFYPSILDPAFNALNRLVVSDDILFPWHWSEIDFHTSCLTGDHYYSEIEVRDQTTDERGNIIVSYNIRLYNAELQVILSADNYKVKNALSGQGTELSTYFKQEQFILTDYEAHQKERSTLHIVHESRRNRVMGRTTLYFNELTDLQQLDLRLIEAEQIYFWDRDYTDETAIASDTYELSQFLLRIHKELKINSFYYASSAVFGFDNMNALNRSIAMGTYSLRLEMNYRIVILDTDDQVDAENLAKIDFLQEDLVVVRHQQYYRIRFKQLKLAPISIPKFNTNTVLVIGGGAGIGLAYTRYMTEQYPNIRIVVAGRKPIWTASESMLGRQVEYVSLDITDEARLQSFAAAQQHMDYILNFAGEPGSGLFVNKSKSDFCERTRSKINGSSLLKRYFPNVKEIIHFSSLAGLIGAMGQSEYCTANAYQSGIAYGDSNVRTLNLTGWTDVGMSAGKDDYYFEKLHSEAGVKLIDWFVQSDVGQAFMFKTKPAVEEYASIFHKMTKALISRSAMHETTSSSNSIHEDIEQVWKCTLGDDEYELEVSFFEQGGDSITIVHLCDELNKSFPGVFDVTTLFSIPTIQGQIDWVKQTTSQTKRTPDAKDQYVDAADILAFLSN